MITKHQIYIKSMGVYINKKEPVGERLFSPFHLRGGLYWSLKLRGVSVLYNPSPMILDVKV